MSFGIRSCIYRCNGDIIGLTLAGAHMTTNQPDSPNFTLSELAFHARLRHTPFRTIVNVWSSSDVKTSDHGQISASAHSQAQTRRRGSVDEVLTNTINATLIAPPGLPDDLAGELAAMRLLSDRALQTATHPSLAPAQQHRLQQLNRTAGERTLTPTEAAEQTALLAAYHRSILRRAQALAILTERGYPVRPTPFDAPPTDDEADDSEATA